MKAATPPKWSGVKDVSNFLAVCRAIAFWPGIQFSSCARIRTTCPAHNDSKIIKN